MVGACDKEGAGQTSKLKLKKRKKILKEKQ
jgi:hypothetical protein